MSPPYRSIALILWLALAPPTSMAVVSAPALVDELLARSHPQLQGRNPGTTGGPLQRRPDHHLGDLECQWQWLWNPPPLLQQPSAASLQATRRRVRVGLGLPQVGPSLPALVQVLEAIPQRAQSRSLAQPRLLVAVPPDLRPPGASRDEAPAHPTHLHSRGRGQAADQHLNPRPPPAKYRPPARRHDLRPPSPTH
jgi:hypothetical protein